MVHGDGEVYATQLEVVEQRVDSHGFVVVGENSNDIVSAAGGSGRKFVYGDGVDNVFADLLEVYAVRDAKLRRAREAVVKVERQQGVDMGVVDRRETRDLDGSKVAMVCSSHTDEAVARGGAAGIEGQCRYVGLCLGGGVEAVDVGAARIVDEVLFRGADEVPQLVVSAPVSRVVWQQGGSVAAHAMGILVG